jgi:recombination protein RecA
MRRKLARIKQDTLVKQVIEVSKHSRRDSEANSSLLIPSGSTLLNLACSDNYQGAYGVGKVINIIGDSSSGKSFLALSCLAEGSMIKSFGDYDLYYDDAEDALEFDIKKLFGEKLSNRLILSSNSDTIEDFYGNIIKVIKKDKPFIYILDSLDSVSSVDEQKRAEVYGSGKIPDGSYKMDKPKLVSEILRVITRDIKQKEALVMVVSQTRDNIGFGAMFKPKVRSGGKALTFYSCHEIWLAIKSRIKEKNRETGVTTQAKITKNKLTGKRRTIEFPINYSYGIDNIMANINFLIEENYWRKEGKSKIIAKDFRLEGTMRKLLVEIEEKNLEKELNLLVADAWRNIEESIQPSRKEKY